MTYVAHTDISDTCISIETVELLHEYLPEVYNRISQLMNISQLIFNRMTTIDK